MEIMKTSAAISVIILVIFVNLSLGKECTSVDVRGDPKNLIQLQECTVVKGFVLIALVQRNATASNWERFKFPALREITEYLIIYDSIGLRSLKDLFPNLTVIRGKKLFLNYALAFYVLPDLETVDLKSLVAIQRGHVFIAGCPKACFLNRINWDRLTLAPGENHINSSPKAKCSEDCKGCNYCWSNLNCQKFENDNVHHLLKGISNCHQNCLGGCYNSTNAGCVVCRGITDDGICVDECPKDKYLDNAHLRCYAKQECLSNKRVIMAKECVKICPSGYQVNTTTSECTKCPTGCQKICGEPGGLTVQQLSDVESLDGCEIINSSLVMRIRNKVDVRELEKYVGKIKEIRGYLRIHKSPFITSLSFFKNLETIAGNILEHDHYGLIIYDNKHLEEFWDQNRTVNLLKGGIYIHLNNKLCNRKAKEFQNTIKHDKKFDSIQINEQEVLCDPIMMTAQVKILSHDSVRVFWKKDQVESLVEILYKEISKKGNVTDYVEDGENVCTRIIWTRVLLKSNELQVADGFFHINITNLKQNTRYALLVKTFNEDNSSSYQSEMASFVTLPDLPSMLKQISTLNKTTDSLTLQWSHNNALDEVRTHYIVDIYVDPDKLEDLDSRDYCIYPRKWHSKWHNFDDYDECCAKKQDEVEDDEFADNMNREFSKPLIEESNPTYIKRLQFKANRTQQIICGLDRYTSYIFKMFVCNQFGCGPYFLYNDRTNLSTTVDRVDDLSACTFSNNNGFRIKFNEPANPNGAIVSYVVHFRRSKANTPDEYAATSVVCLTRIRHALANFQFVTHASQPFEEVAIRSNSLSGTILSPYVKVEVCENFLADEGDFSIFGLLAALTLTAIFFGGGYYVFRNRDWLKVPGWLQLRLPARNHHVRMTNDEEILMEEFETVRFEINDDEGYSD